MSRKAENGGDAVSGSIRDANKNIIKTLPKSVLERRFQHNKDTDWAGYINLSYDTHFANDVEALGRRVRSIAEKNAAIDIILTSSILPTSRRRWMETD